MNLVMFFTNQDENKFDRANISHAHSTSGDAAKCNCAVFLKFSPHLKTKIKIEKLMYSLTLGISQEHRK